MSNGRIRLLPDPLTAVSFEGNGVCKDGYKWVRTKWKVNPAEELYFEPGPWVGLVLIPNAIHRLRYFNPLSIPTLFRTFAQTGTDPDSILEFANQYGNLGPGVTLLSSKLEREVVGMMADALDRWVAEICNMRDAIRIWDAYQTGQEDELRKLVMTLDEVAPALRRRIEAAVSARAKSDGSPGGRFRLTEPWYSAQSDKDGIINWVIGYTHRDYTRDPAGNYDSRIVHLNRREAARAILARIANEQFECFSRIQLDERERLTAEYRVRVVPQHLLGAVWWQFSRLLIGEATYRPCKVCGTPMEISTGDYGGRTNREFCTDACKLKDHRRKVREAKAMRADGKSVKHIAKHFETEPGVIENWLTKRK
jgi:hypothetical protein